MVKWKYARPTNLYFGDDWLEELNSLLDTWPSNLRPCIVCGKSAARNNGWIEKLTSNLDNRKLLVFDRIEPEPSHNTVKAGAEFLNGNSATSVIALGGGSVIDAAKMMVCLCETDVEIASLMNREKPVPNRQMPLIALPTTAGSGSEMTPFSVLTNTDTGERQSLPAFQFYPDIAIVAPTFLQSVPKNVIGDTGFDALAHAFEALWSVHSNQVSDALAFRAIGGCAKFLLRYYRDSGDSAAAEGMAFAASLAGMAFSTTFTAACHGLSYPIGRRFKISHGASCGMTLHLVAQVNKNAVARKFSDLAQVLNLASADAIPEFIWNILRDLPTIKSFRELRATKEDIEEIAKRAYAPLMNNNPVPLNENEIFNLLIAEIV